MIALALFEKYLIYSVETQNGRTDYYYYDAITWIVGTLFVSWLAWVFVKRAIRARKFIRKRKNKIPKSFSNVVKAKNELSREFLRKGVSENIHAVGIGKLPETGEDCLHVFINDGDAEFFNETKDKGIATEHNEIPVVLIELPVASFFGFVVEIDKNSGKPMQIPDIVEPIRGKVDKIVGGVSGANANLNGQSGTIGYFCKKRSILPKRSETYLLSNTHVFADLKTEKFDDNDLIVQPSPGEPGKSEPIGELANCSNIKLGNDIDSPNKTDAAIAKLWKTQESECLIPMIGKVKGFAKADDVQIGESARKFGRTTGFTSGKIFSRNLDIWITYDRTGEKAFFKDQMLIEPNSNYERFVDKGDSGSLVVDDENYASGLIFAGANGRLTPEDKNVNDAKLKSEKRIDNFGVANPIDSVIETLKIEFL